MRVGCGLRVRRIDGNDYLYFWHYEWEAGRSARREDYVGPARDANSRRDAARKLLAYHRRVPQGLASPVAPLSRIACKVRTSAIRNRPGARGPGRMQRVP